MEEVERNRAHMPGSSVVDQRTLAADHRYLAEFLQPGMAVLDVGCATGTITSGIAEAVGPAGRVVGTDINQGLLAIARTANSSLPQLTFELRDVYQLEYEGEFDVVTSSRVLQWLAEPARALSRMVAAARPGGHVIVLDYSHDKLLWEPDVPAPVEHFYKAFLKWRADAGMDNSVADHLPDMFRRSGLVDVRKREQFEDVSPRRFRVRVGCRHLGQSDRLPRAASRSRRLPE